MKKIVLLLTALALGFVSEAKNHLYRLESPDGRLTVCIEDNILTWCETEKAYRTDLSYWINYDGVEALSHSIIGMTREVEGKVLGSMAIRKATRRSIDETIASPFTRQSTMHNLCNELTLQLKDGLSIVFRAYNEGVAYRFVWDGKPGKVIDERVEYRFPNDWTATVPYVTNFDSSKHETQYSSSFENQYTTLPLSKLDPRRLCFLPLLIHNPNGMKMCISESSLLDYPGLYLKSNVLNDEMLQLFSLSGEHAPLPKRVKQGGHNNLQLLVKEREDYIAKMDKTKNFPWRIVMVAESSSQLAMNNMSYLLGEASRVDDISWIKPGKVAWDWWNNWNIGNVPFEAGINNDTYKHYIDFASHYGIEYVILDEGWAVNKQADLFQVVPEIDLPMLVNYAKERGVGIILWAGYHAFDRDMEHVCQHYSEMGVKGFKIDFMDRDDQLVTDFYRRAAEMCAKYKMVVDFHGAFKPAGLNRTYPNVLNFEGVFGLEQMKWAPYTVDQMKYDTEIPFIRQTSGPMDYTQGAMHNAAKGCYFPCWSEPMSQGTRCHQLALYIVLESPLNMLCDSPTNYEKEPDYTRFVAEIPTVWDESLVLQGEVGEYIVTARRKGNTWYIGGITNWQTRDIVIDLSAIKPISNYTIEKIELYTDGRNAHRKGSDYHLSSYENEKLLNIHMAPGGGFVAKISTK